MRKKIIKKLDYQILLFYYAFFPKKNTNTNKQKNNRSGFAINETLPLLGSAIAGGIGGVMMKNFGEVTINP